MTEPTPAQRPPRAAATLAVVRNAAEGIEVLLLQRAERGDHNSGAWVFPGGIVETGDREALAGEPFGLSDAAASARLGLAAGGLGYYLAALRECFEECGLLFATDGGGALLQWPDGEPSPLHEWRGRLHRGEATMAELCAFAGLRPALDRFAYIGHWLTPPGLPKRFDTRFFIAVAPPGQPAQADGGESLAHSWLSPQAALARSDELKLMNPTRATLKQIAGFADVEALMAWAQSPREVGLIMPRIGSGSAGRRPVMPTEPAWAEIGRLDPQGRGDACYDIQPEVTVRLSSRVIRVTANNGSVMTGPGTNSYLVGGGERNEWAVIDPGPLDAAHTAAILAAAPGPIRWIFATHTHLDHSPGCAALQKATGAIVHGRLPAYPEWQDSSFAPEVALTGGERIVIAGAAATLRVVHTPGHASNHLCYLLEEEETLFTGDHVMQLSTVVINPPDGDMAAYVASLRELAAGEPLQWLAPGHGFLMAEPRRAFEHIIAHRLRREAKVLASLRTLGPVTAADLLPHVYDDVSPGLHGVAMRSLQAHLGKLRQDAVAIESNGGRWVAMDAIGAN